MPISLMVVKVDKFYEPGITLGGQDQIIDQDGLGISEGEGHLFLDPTSEQLAFDDCLFDIYKVDYDHRYEDQGFVFDRSFNYYFKNFKFNIYYEKNKRILILNVKKEIAKAFLKEISKETKRKNKLYHFQNLDINFDKVVAKAENLSGLWAQVNRSEVETQAYFGDNINLDEEVKAILKEKKPSYVLLESTIGEFYLKMGITKLGNIVLYNDKKDEKKIIIDAYAIYNHFLTD